MKPDWTIRVLTAADKDRCAEIIFDAFASIADQHRFPRDFSNMESARGLTYAFCGLRGIFGVGAEKDGKLVGSNFLDERNRVPAVGPITVDPAFHGQGCGRRLMQAVLERARNAIGVRLVQDAFNTTSLSLYSSLGFEVREPLALMSGQPRSAGSSLATARFMRSEDLDACGQLCREIHGFDRNGELADDLKTLRPVVLERNGTIVAYASAPARWVMNHGVARTEEDLIELVPAAAALNGGTISLLVPTRRTIFFRACLAAGLRVVKPMTLMSIGQYREPSAAFYPSVGY